VKAGRPVQSRGPEGFPEERTRDFIAAMHARAQDSAKETVRLSGIHHAKRMLDVGGGSGAFSIAFAQACPELRAEILDLGPVVLLASATFARRDCRIVCAFDPGTCARRNLAKDTT